MDALKARTEKYLSRIENGQEPEVKRNVRQRDQGKILRVTRG